MRVFIVDDEPLARRGLRLVLGSIPDVEVAGEAGDGAAAVDALRSTPVHVVFVDVQMPGMDGFELASHIATLEVPPLVVFVTAFDTYAVRAFEESALDYLLKPVDETRVRRAVERASARLGMRAESPRLVFRDGQRVIVLELDEITWIGAEDDYIRVYTRHRNYLVREPLSNLERRTSSSVLVRIHRSTMVNLTQVREFHQIGGGDAWISLRTGERLRVSRRYRTAVAQRVIKSTDREGA